MLGKRAKGGQPGIAAADAVAAFGFQKVLEIQGQAGIEIVQGQLGRAFVAVLIEVI